MREIREVANGETHRAAPALLELRPDAGPLDALISRIDVQRGAGYRIVGAFDEDQDAAAAVIGFKVAENLVWGRHLYIEDVVTRAWTRLVADSQRQVNSPVGIPHPHRQADERAPVRARVEASPALAVVVTP